MKKILIGSMLVATLFFGGQVQVAAERNNINEMPVTVDPLDEIINIPDEDLREYLTSWFGVSKDSEITRRQMESLESLPFVSMYGIADLTGLESAINLRSLDFSIREPGKADLSPLESLTKLEHVYISGSDDGLFDLNSFRNAKGLISFRFQSVKPIDLSAFHQFEKLEELSMHGHITDGEWNLDLNKFKSLKRVEFASTMLNDLTVFDNQPTHLFPDFVSGNWGGPYQTVVGKRMPNGDVKVKLPVKLSEGMYIGWQDAENNIVKEELIDNIVTLKNISLEETETWYHTDIFKNDRFINLCRLNVIIEDMDELTLSPATHTLNVGKSKLLSVKANEAGVSLSKVTYTSSDPSVVKVFSNGKIQALKKGQATITAKANLSNGNEAQAQSVITVE